jgi:hypothetical protein
LPRSKTIESSVILFDSIFASVLLVFCRASGRIFDDLFGKENFLDLTMKKLANWSRLRPPGVVRDEPAVPQLDLQETSGKESELDKRPN